MPFHGMPVTILPFPFILPIDLRNAIFPCYGYPLRTSSTYHPCSTPKIRAAVLDFHRYQARMLPGKWNDPLFCLPVPLSCLTDEQARTNKRTVTYIKELYSLWHFKRLRFSYLLCRNFLFVVSLPSIGSADNALPF
jgi:hypothetical protein